MLFKDKNILIIGGTSEVGLETALQLKEKEANMLIISRKNYEGAKKAGLQHFALDVLHLNKSFTEQFPEVLHGLVYYPGSMRIKPFERLKPADFRDKLELNVLWAVQVLQAVAPFLKKAEGVSVVFFSTVAAKVGITFQASIATAKAALEGLAVVLTTEYATAKIRFNVIAPSLTDTPLASSLLSTPEKTEAAGSRHPLGRVGQPQDLAPAAAFLLPDASSWMTGQVLHKDGGMSSVKLL